MKILNPNEIEAVSGADTFGHIVGAAVGFVVGGPVGAIVGAEAGDQLQDAVNEFGEKHDLN